MVVQASWVMVLGLRHERHSVMAEIASSRGRVKRFCQRRMSSSEMWEFLEVAASNAVMLAARSSQALRNSMLLVIGVLVCCIVYLG